MPVNLPPDYQPGPDEPYMNDTMREYFRQLLLNWRHELLEDSDDTRTHLTENLSTDSDFVDRASNDLDQAIELRTRDRERKLLKKIDEALQRIKDKTYGFCADTGDPIGIRRLQARPIATLSLAAQERHEKMEIDFSATEE
ncbi:MAG: RNA polymerase-binding protein DksA [bacterium]|nr:RNA polymerase-binding protein DksA [bacterium]